MASNIPIRRITRTTRTTTIKESENANARPSRIATRSKPASATSTASGNAPATRATAATAASRGKAALSDSKLDPAAQGKRKREALVEVTSRVTNKSKPKEVAPPEDAPEKPLKPKVIKTVAKAEPVVAKAKTVTKTAAVVEQARQPLRTVAGPTTRRTTRATVVAAAPEPKPVQKVKQQPRIEVHQDEPMVIDVPTSTARSVNPRKVTESTKVSVNPRKVTESTKVSVARHAEIYRRSREAVVAEQQQRIVEDAEDDRVFKKRRTSSDAPVDADAEEEKPPLNEDKIALETYAEEDPEADPFGHEWDDLDAGDDDDPLMVSEYVNDIVKYLKELEVTTMPNPDYMRCQKELAWNMRGILTDWLVTIHVRFRLLPETLFVCVNIIDRFLSARVVSLAKLQLVGVTCLFIASKAEEICAPSVKAFLSCADSTYTASEILQAERYILKTIEWNLSYPNPLQFLRRISKADDYDVTIRTVAKYLLEIPCIDWRLIVAPPSLTAAASIWLARLVLARGPWNANLAHYSGYSESMIIPTANLMLNYILRPIKHESFFKKYAGKRYLKSSVYLREWALQRWPENTTVDLKADLPQLKADMMLYQLQATEGNELKGAGDLLDEGEGAHTAES